MQYGSTVVSTQFAVDLVFKTQGSKKIKDASKGVKQVSDAAKKAQGSISGATNNIRKFGATAKASSAGIKSMGAAFSSMLGPIALVTAAIAGIGKAFSAAADKEKELMALRRGLENLGITGDEVLGALEQKAKEFGEQTLFSPTQYRQAAASLTSFRNIAVNDFDDVIEMSANVAQAMGTNVKDASLQLAKALNAPTIGITALNRSGIQFTETQKEQIKAMEAAGNIAGAQALIMKELELQYGGVAKAAGEGLAGSFDLLGQRIQEAFESLGKLLEPLAGPILAGAVKVLEGMTGLWEYIASNLFPKVTKALEPITKQFEDTDWTSVLDQVGLILQNSIIKYLEAIVSVVGKISTVVGVVIQQFKRLSDNPVFKFIADQVGRLAKMLGLTGGKMQEYNDQQKKVAENADAILAGTEAVAPAVDEATESTKELEAAQKEISKRIKETNAELGRQYQASEKIKDMQMELAQQIRQTELAVTQALLDQAEAKLESAKNEKDRIKAAKDIYKLTIQQAEVEREMARSAVAESVRKAQAQVELLTLKQKEVQIAVSLAKAEGSLHTAHLEALGVAQEAVALSQQQLGIRMQIAQAQYKEIDALYSAKEATAKTAFEQNKVFEATKNASSAAASFAQNMNNAATQAERAASATARASGGGVGPSSPSVLQQGGKKIVRQSTFPNHNLESVNHVLKNQSNVPTFQDSKGNYHIDYSKGKINAGNSYDIHNNLEDQIRNHQALQDPGHLRNQQRARIAMEQMRMQNQYYEQQKASGRSDSEINIVYGGNTLEFDGDKYVMRDDVDGILKQAVEQMQSNMTRSARSRLNMGLR